RHPGQRAAAGADRDQVRFGVDRQQGDLRARGGRHSARPLGQARGDGRHRAVPGVRRLQLHQRRLHHRRWRHAERTYLGPFDAQEGERMTTNTQIKLARRPVGEPQGSDFEISTATVPEPGEGQVLIKVLYLSLDPAMRGWMNEGKSYVPPVQIGEVMRALGAGRVVASRHPDFAVGDHVTGTTGVQEYAVLDGSELTKVDPSVAPLPTFLHVLGMTGMTAYFGLLEVGQPKAGETVVVSGAAGAVGTVVGQIAKLKGCRVVGIAGGKEKCDFLTGELGFDAAVDYKRGDLKAALRAACPEGVDVFFDNVGGDILDTVLTRLRMHARIVICGAISQYNNTTPVKGPS